VFCVLNLNSAWGASWVHLGVCMWSQFNAKSEGGSFSSRQRLLLHERCVQRHVLHERCLRRHMLHDWCLQTHMLPEWCLRRHILSEWCVQRHMLHDWCLQTHMLPDWCLQRYVLLLRYCPLSLTSLLPPRQATPLKILERIAVVGVQQVLIPGVGSDTLPFN